MKNSLLLCISTFSCLGLLAQQKQIIRADSVYIQRDGGNGELILLNSTRDSTGGVLSNIGKGRTAFLKAKVVNDSMVTIGGDTLMIFHRREANDVLVHTSSPADCRDTSFTDPYGVVINHYTLSYIPQFIGSRVRVNWFGSGLIPDNDSYGIGWWQHYDPGTGYLYMFMGGYGGCNSGETFLIVSAY